MRERWRGLGREGWRADREVDWEGEGLGAREGIFVACLPAHHRAVFTTVVAG